MDTKTATIWISGLCLAAAIAATAPTKAHKTTSISPRKLADSLHAVIAADRSIYAREVVQRLAVEAGRIPVDSAWRERQCLPTHAQMLRLAATSIQQRGAEFSYTLRSLWPINPAAAPQTQVEQTGLEFVAAHPGTNYYTEELLGGRSYFTAVYADTAVLSSCVACHNTHPDSPRRDFRTNDVLGALVVRVPLEF